MGSVLETPREEVTPPAKPPRIWPVFVAPVAAFLGAVLAQMVIAVAAALWLLGKGTGPQQLTAELVALLTTPVVFMLLAALSQVSMFLAAVVPARLSPEPTLLRLRLVRPALPAWGYPTLAVAALVPLAAGLGLAYALTRVLPADESAEGLYQQMTLAVAVPFVLFIALAPGFCEELLFRGYVQGRLLRRWPAWAAIAVTSVLFMLMHVTPHAMAAVLPLGIWLGVVAWRTGSIWPGAVCHAFVNGAWNVWHIGWRLTDSSEVPPTPVFIGVGVVALACFALSCHLLRRPGPPDKQKDDAVAAAPEPPL
jgi:membrane protease YdiL (CAAX protease family)